MLMLNLVSLLPLLGPLLPLLATVVALGMDDPFYVLIHSPLVGPFSWSGIAQEMMARGLQATTPPLRDKPDSSRPYWEQHVYSVAQAMQTIPADRPVVLAGHSGAGPFLPAVGQAIRQPVAAYLFIDAGLPVDGASRLELLEMESAELAEGFRQQLVAGARYPDWSEEDLRMLIPDDRSRRALAAELQPRPLAFFDEPLPVFSAWPDAPCAYLHFSPAYERHARRALKSGWPVARLPGGHFHMLVDPPGVTTSMLELTRLCLGEK